MRLVAHLDSINIRHGVVRVKFKASADQLPNTVRVVTYAMEQKPFRMTVEEEGAKLTVRKGVTDEEGRLLWNKAYLRNFRVKVEGEFDMDVEFEIGAQVLFLGQMDGVNLLVDIGSDEEAQG